MEDISPAPAQIAATAKMKAEVLLEVVVGSNLLLENEFEVPASAMTDGHRGTQTAKLQSKISLNLVLVRTKMVMVMVQGVLVLVLVLPIPLTSTTGTVMKYQFRISNGNGFGFPQTYLY